MRTQGKHADVVFLSGVRTGFGKFGGALKDFSAIQLSAAAARHALEDWAAEARRRPWWRARPSRRRTA